MKIDVQDQGFIRCSLDESGAVEINIGSSKIASKSSIVLSFDQAKEVAEFVFAHLQGRTWRSEEGRDAIHSPN